MSFLDAAVNLDNTIFSQAELNLAREYLVDLIYRIDPYWLRKPVGYFSNYWLSDEPESVCRVIDFAFTLNRLEMSGLQAGSKAVFIKKVKALLRHIYKKEAFEEALTELEVGAILAQRAQPLLLEPYIIEPKADKAKPFIPASRARLVDLALLSPQGEALFIDVTVFRSESINLWTRAARNLAKLLFLTLASEELCRHIRVELPFPAPLELTGPEQDSPTVRAFLNAIVRQKQGSTGLPVASENQEISLEWQEHKFENSDQSDDRPTLSFTFPQGSLICYVKSDCFADFLEKTLKSIRNSLKVKREQFQLDSPLVLVIKIGNNLLTEKLLLKLIERRLWSNSRFNWLSGIVLFKPRSGFQLTDSAPALLLSSNPNARFPANRELLAYFY
ncbi:MAG TPA: hypothetical protein VH186_15275 [Chloroflexia bacterium]|nr:hypothetical protein [Chloroflexia bacterium]